MLLMIHCGKSLSILITIMLDMIHYTTMICRVSDLQHCDVCIGGGFPVISFNTDHTFKDSTFGEIDPNDGNDDTKAIQIYRQPGRESLLDQMPLH